MLFLITQTHTYESCPKDQGGSNILYDPEAEGVTPKAIYGAYSEHVVYYVVEAESLDAIHRFLLPGFKRCTSHITPIAEEPVV
ncbi:MAG: hypothetical protein PVF51_10810 [Nitrospirota bacterium]|jgi:hypothetical protein